MKSTSPGLRLVRSPARSPGLSSTGPEVTFNCACISLAMMFANVVLPSPGGPCSSTWSSESHQSRLDENPEVIHDLLLPGEVVQFAGADLIFELQVAFDVPDVFFGAHSPFCFGQR